jgi:glycine betaine/proline transport system substrate-binding protein
MEEMDWEAQETAIWFLEEREEIWTEWVSPDIQEKVKNALAAL